MPFGIVDVALVFLLGEIHDVREQHTRTASKNASSGELGATLTLKVATYHSFSYLKA